ncbi:MAG: hypothetical protein R3266_02500, partial [Gemmatimonadota bacterium]|nr:hypothetical protein [Gemmatimonadota bacterium]
MSRARERRRGSSRKARFVEAWEGLAAELGGELELEKRGKPERLTARHGPWTLVADIHTVNAGETSTKYTRVRALFRRARPFSLRVTRRNPLHRLAPLVGLRGVRLGYDRADRALFIRSDRPGLARTALRGTSLGQALPGLIRRTTLRVTRPGRRIRRSSAEDLGEVQVLRRGIERD